MLMSGEAGRIRGKVLSYSPGRGYGWIAPDDGSRDVFVHERQIATANLPGLSVGQKVEFDLKEGRDGKMSAENLKVLETTK